MTESVNALAFLADQLADHDAHWSLGTFGALAEFTRDAGEPAALSRDDHAVSVVTDRGGIRLAPVSGMRLFASESATRESWNHRVSLCLPEDRCVMGRRATLTELGLDTEALREQDRDAILFDLGLAAMQADACIRVADSRLVTELRA